MMVQLKIVQGPLFILQLYLPGSSNSEDVKKEFLSRFQHQINKLSKNSSKIILGDLNGKGG